MRSEWQWPSVTWRPGYNQSGNEIVDHYTYMMCGDGDMMEGVSAEAASLAGHLGLDRLICIYDDNKISIEGSTAIAFSEDVAMRFKAYNWQVLTVADGNDLEAIAQALAAAQDETAKPTLIMLRTHIAYGSPNKQDTADAHGAPLGEKEIALTKEGLGWPGQEAFHVPQEALEQFRVCIKKGEAAEAAWKAKVKSYTKAFPELADQWVNALSGYLSRTWDDGIPVFTTADAPIATRAASGKVLNAIAGEISDLDGRIGRSGAIQ